MSELKWQTGPLPMMGHYMVEATGMRFVFTDEEGQDLWPGRRWYGPIYIPPLEPPADEPKEAK